MRTRVFHLFVAGLILATLAIPAVAQRQLPFHGTFQGSDREVGPLGLATTVRGTGSLLGQFLLTQEVTVNISDFTNSGSAHWTAANGDTIDTDVVGAAVPGADVLQITEIHTITGGTGRFSRAQGTFTVHRLHVLVPSTDGTHV